MHILIAANNVFPDPDAGGSGRYVHEVGRRLVDRGHDVSILTRKRGDVPVSDTVAGMTVHRYDGSATSLPSAVQSVAQWVRNRHAINSIDILNIHGALSGILVNWTLPEEVPRVYTFHGPWPAEYRERNHRKPLPVVRLGTEARRLVEGRVLSHTDCTVTLSKFMQSQLETWHPDAPTGPVVPGGVDLDRFTPDATTNRSLSDASTAFLTVRRLTPRMGLESLIDAFAVAHATNPDIHLYIAGNGPLRDSLEQRAIDRDVADYVTFLGFVPEADLPGVYAAADVFVLPTTALEGFGLATLEALASGTPAIATDVGGTPEILRPLDNRLADTSVPPMLLSENDDLSGRLSEWAACSVDARAHAGVESRNYIEETFSWEHTTDSVEAVFHDLRGDGA